MTLPEYQAEVNRICAELNRLPCSERLGKLKSELARLPPEFRETTLTLVATTVEITEYHEGMKTWEKITMMAAGAVIIAVLLVIAFLVPEPTKFQVFVFRIVLALGASAFGCVIPGFLNIESRSKLLLLRAGGALALFVLIYLWNPPELATASKPNHSIDTVQTNRSQPVSETNR
jgi:type II secretory pathway component PulM